MCNQLRVSHPVDNDPHFIIHLRRSDTNVCFNIDSKPGHILNLVSDSGTGNTPVYITLTLTEVPGFDWLTLNFVVPKVWW